MSSSYSRITAARSIYVYCQKVFLGATQVGGYQLERIAAGETDILYLLPEQVWDRSTIDNPAAKAIFDLTSLKQCCQYCSSVNSAIKSKDPSFDHLDGDVYCRWKEGISREISKIQVDLFDAVDTLCPQTDPVVTILHKIEDSFALIPDAADASELVAVLEDVNSYIISKYSTHEQFDQLSIMSSY